MNGSLRPRPSRVSLWTRDGFLTPLLPYTEVLMGNSVVVRRYGWTVKQAHRKAILTLAKILEHDLTGNFIRAYRPR